MKIDGAQYTDEIEQPAELPFCSCHLEYKYSLDSIPPELLTVAGKAELVRVQAVTASA